MTRACGLRTFFRRLHPFVLAPGGIGTVPEMRMIWPLLQVGRVKDVPLSLAGKRRPGLVAWARTAMLAEDPPPASAGGFDIPRCAAGGDAAAAILREAHAAWKARG